MRGYNRFLADAECIVESLFAGMADVHHHAYTVHFPNHLLAKGIHTQAFVIISARAAKLVVAVVTEGHIYHAPTAEAFDVAQVLADGITILDAEHDGLLAFALQAVEVGRRVGDVYIVSTLCHHCFDFIQDAVGLGSSSEQVLIRQSQLLQISHHDGRIQASFRHFVEVHQYLRITTGEVYLLVEEHRCVAM